jgi:hypothetical protein
MALTKKSSATIPHGLGSEVSAAKTATGLATITNADVSAELSVNTMAKDETGEFVAHLVGDTKHTIALKGHTSAAELPTLGAQLTFAGRQGAVISANISASNEDFIKASINAEGHVGTGTGSYS